MKKLFISAVLALSIISSSFAANVTIGNSRAQRNFSNEFTSAENVTWTSTDKYAKANFTLGAKSMEAYYDNEGNMIGSSSKIEVADLPTNAKRLFAKKYTGYTVKEAVQFEGIIETAYYISAENETQTVILKVSTAGFVSVFRSVKK